MYLSYLGELKDQNPGKPIDRLCVRNETIRKKTDGSMPEIKDSETHCASEVLLKKDN